MMTALAMNYSFRSAQKDDQSIMRQACKSSEKIAAAINAKEYAPIVMDRVFSTSGLFSSDIWWLREVVRTLLRVWPVVSRWQLSPTRRAYRKALQQKERELTAQLRQSTLP